MSYNAQGIKRQRGNIRGKGRDGGKGKLELRQSTFQSIPAARGSMVWELRGKWK